MLIEELLLKHEVAVVNVVDGYYRYDGHYNISTFLEKIYIIHVVADEYYCLFMFFISELLTLINNFIVYIENHVFHTADDKR